MQIDIRGNNLLDCPDPAAVSSMVQVVCDADTDSSISISDEQMSVIAPSSSIRAEAPSRSGPGLAGGAIAGVVIAVVAAVAIAAILAVAALRRYKQRKQDAWTDAAYQESATTVTAAAMG